MSRLTIAAIALITTLSGCVQSSNPGSTAMPNEISTGSSNRLFPISVEGKWGFIDATGKVVIPPQFIEVGEFSDGLARVTVPGLTEEDRVFERKASGFIDELGKFVIGPGPPQGYKFPEYRNDYTYGDFHNGRAKFWVGDATGFGGFIDRTGKLAIPPQYANVDDFSEGLACVSLRRADGSAFGPKLAGVINTSGGFVILPTREFVAHGFSEGLCVIHLQDDEDEGVWHSSVIDLNGKVVIPPHIYTGISDFIGGISRVVKAGKVGCINAKGDVVIPIEFDQLWEFEHSSVSTGTKAGKHFIVDRMGRCMKEISLGKEVNLGRLKSGMASVEVDHRTGYVSAEGDLVIPMRFDRGEEFRGELALVELDSFRGYINQQGEFVWKTDRWDEPIRNAVKKPLSDLLPPDTIEALPLDYNRGGVENAIVFASKAQFDSLRPWFTKTCHGRFELVGESDEPELMNVSFFGEALSGSFHAVDAKGEHVEDFMSFYVSDNMKRLKEKHQPNVIGILILDR